MLFTHGLTVAFVYLQNFKLKQLVSIIVFVMMGPLLKSQSVTQIKKVLDTTSDPIGFVKFVLKKKYKIDTVTVMSTTSFMGLADSLAYKGKIGKVYGPFKGGNYLIKVLAKVPNTFYHVSHILIDTATFSRKFADSLAGRLLRKSNRTVRHSVLWQELTALIAPPLPEEETWAGLYVVLCCLNLTMPLQPQER